MERVIPNGTTNTARMHDAKIRQAMSARKAKTRRVKDMEAPRWKLTESKSNHAARCVNDQVIHIKQAVAARIDKIQTAELGQLEKQR